MPFHATPRGLFGPSFLAMIMFKKFGTHQPLNRQRYHYAREGVDLSLSTPADQVGACAATTGHSQGQHPQLRCTAVRAWLDAACPRPR